MDQTVVAFQLYVGRRVREVDQINWSRLAICHKHLSLIILDFVTSWSGVAYARF